MKRRDFIAMLGGAAAAWPLGVRAQQGEGVRRVGVLMGYPDNNLEAQAWVATFHQGLQKLGWVEGRNVHSDSRWAGGEDTEALQKFARELVALDPHVILSSSTPSTAALVQETRSIPIVFAIAVDPVGSGFVANFNHPGGNVTGFTNHEPTMAGKWLELLKEIAPRVRRAALLYNPATAPYFEQFLSPFKTAAASLGVEVIASPVHDRSDLELAIAALTRVPNGGLVVMTDSYMVAQRAEVTSLALRYRLPLISPYRAYSELGGYSSRANCPCRCRRSSS